jgi:MFS family permease
MSSSRQASSSSVNGIIPESKETSTMPALGETNPEFKPGMAFYLAFSSICIVTLAAAFDATSLSIAIPIVTEKLHGTAIEAFWSGTSFLVTSAVFQPVIAGLSHGFGRKQVWHLIRVLLAGAFQCSYFAVDPCILVILRRWIYFGRCG